MEGFQPVTATKRIFNLKKRIRAVGGGTAASKSISILIWLIDYAQTTKEEVITVVSESYPHLEGGVIRDFKAIMKSQEYWEDSCWNDSKHIYTFYKGTIIEFRSIDKFGKAHGPRRDILFLNEANNIDYRIADQLITRTRKIVWLDWNPSEEFWFYTEMLGKREDVDFITLTYLDNEALDESTKLEIESHKNNKNWWKVYGEGQLGEIEGRIYKDWQIIDEIPHNARLERRWLDFGYSNDPSSIGDVYYYNGGYILDEQLYQKGMLNKQLADYVKNLPNPQTLMVADSAEPKSIDELKMHGLNVIPCEKGADSVRNGIAVVQGQRISITKRSINTIKEYRNYLWLVDKDGNIINEEDPKLANHSMSGIRYVLTSIIKKPDIKYPLPTAPIKPYYGDRDIAF
jgi:phage terminase large subunit